MKKYSRDYEGRCGKCHALINEEDKFCRYCGTPKGKGAFLPYENVLSYVYGPPTETTHTCKECGYTWTVNMLCIDNAQYCPKCCGGLDSTHECKL
ncbi:MAG: zinc-ribbon domain-containing protein [Clostridiales bacterium]|nr:zinc-ribbon domain-containing protein [Clostridiales bacterium]